MRVKVTPEIVQDLERAIELLGSKAELGRRLGYASEGRVIQHLLYGRIKTIFAKQLQILDNIISTVHLSNRSKNGGLPTEHVNLWPP